MRPFQVGDEVIRTGLTKIDYNVFQGEKYIIEEFRDSGYFKLIGRSGWWNPELFKHATKTASGFKAFQQKLETV